MTLRMIERAAVLAGFAVLWLVLIASILRPADMRALNRAAEPRPDFALAAFGDPDYRARWTGWFTDKLVLGGAARQANVAIERLVFSDAAGSRVVAGADGWLFLNRTSANANLLPGTDGAREQAAFEGAVGALDVLSARGIDARFALAPHKPSIYPQHLPDYLQASQAAEARNRAALMDRLVEARGAQILDVFDAMADAAGEGGLYLREDTHWSAHGAAIMAEAVIEAFAPGLWETAAIEVAEPVGYTPDLVTLQGGEAEALRPVLDVRRPGVTAGRIPHGADDPPWLLRTAADGPADALLGDLVIVGDSYALELQPLLAPFFATTTIVTMEGLDSEAAAAALAEADHALIHIVERHTLAPAPLGPAGLGARLEAALARGR
ncbi:MAG: alginate O-acetyltransferase AlgX-related protein [Oceanicaulis sp.]